MSEELERRMASDDIEIRQPYGVIWVDEGRGLHIPFPKATIPVIGLLCVSTLLLGYESLKIPINSATGEIVSKTDQIDRNGALAFTNYQIQNSAGVDYFFRVRSTFDGRDPSKVDVGEVVNFPIRYASPLLGREIQGFEKTENGYEGLLDLSVLRE